MKKSCITNIVMLFFSIVTNALSGDEMTRLHKGQSEYIDTLATMHESPEL